MSSVQVGRSIAHIVVGTTQQRIEEFLTVHPDASMDCPGVHGVPDISESPEPGIDMKIVGIDETAVDIEKRCANGHGPG
jgi:hypothetical protein